MGYVHATVELSNPRLPQLEAVATQALADSGALMLCIPAALAQQLQLTQESEREVSVADGRSIRVPPYPWKTWTSASTQAGSGWSPTPAARTFPMRW